MTYRDAFYSTVVLLIIVLISGTYFVYRIDKKLDTIDLMAAERIVDSYVEAGWIPPLGLKDKK